jgi:hypothetical protein
VVSKWGRTPQALERQLGRCAHARRRYTSDAARLDPAEASAEPQLHANGGGPGLVRTQRERLLELARGVVEGERGHRDVARPLVVPAACSSCPAPWWCSASCSGVASSR